MPKHPGAVTVAVSRRIKSGTEAEYEKWAEGLSACAQGFPGFLGEGDLRPSEESGEYTLVYRYDSQKHLDRYLDSPQRKEWIAKSQAFVEGQPHTETATGLEYWFQDPSDPGTAPPVWKQAVLTWVGLYPTSLVIAYLIGWLVNPWPPPLHYIVTTPIIVILMTWVAMPIVTRVFAFWVRPGVRMG